MNNKVLLPVIIFIGLFIAVIVTLILLNVRKKKVIGVDCIGSNTYELIVADTVPPVVKMAMALENEISNNCGSPSVTKEYDKLNQAFGNKLIWRKDGLEYSLFIGLHDSNSFMVVDYDVNEIKK